MRGCLCACAPSQEVNVGLHWMVESARLVHNMHVASHADDQAKTDTLTEAISQAIEAIPPLQIPSFPLIHFNRMRKHTVRERPAAAQPRVFRIF